MKLWLDDIRDPLEYGAIGFIWVKTVEDAITMLKTGEVSFASLDHDLSILATLGNFEKEQTGYELVCWMEENNVWPVDGVRVHSMNPIGRQRMEKVIRRAYET